MANLQIHGILACVGPTHSGRCDVAVTDAHNTPACYLFSLVHHYLIDSTLRQSLAQFANAGTRHPGFP
jgi:hypothetical protein